MTAPVPLARASWRDRVRQAVAQVHAGRRRAGPAEDRADPDSGPGRRCRAITQPPAPRPPVARTAGLAARSHAEARGRRADRAGHVEDVPGRPRRGSGPAGGRTSPIAVTSIDQRARRSA